MSEDIVTRTKAMLDTIALAQDRAIAHAYVDDAYAAMLRELLDEVQALRTARPPAGILRGLMIRVGVTLAFLGITFWITTGSPIAIALGATGGAGVLLATARLRGGPLLALRKIEVDDAADQLSGSSSGSPLEPRATRASRATSTKYRAEQRLREP